jgi:FKBP-type peptidyl-prolyl cis-trans isomerase
MVIGTAALSLGMLIGLIGCDRSSNETVTAQRNPSTARLPTTEEATMPSDEPERKDLDPVPPLGVPMAVKMPTGEVWSKYPNGMMIFDVKPGSGMTPQVGMTAHVHYIGRFPDGKIFDQSTDKTFNFVLGSRGIIKGWNMAVSTMMVGGKRKVFLPSALAYGPGGNLPLIYPNQDLTFEIELVSITGKAVIFPDTQPATAAALDSRQMGPSTKPAK